MGDPIISKVDYDDYTKEQRVFHAYTGSAPQLGFDQYIQLL